MIDRDDQFIDLGYTSPEEAEALHVKKLAGQRIDDVTRGSQRSKRGKTSTVRDYESDRDHTDTIAAMPSGSILEVDDHHHEDDVPPKLAKLAVRIAARRAGIRAIYDDTEGDDTLRQARLRAFNETHPKIT